MYCKINIEILANGESVLQKLNKLQLSYNPVIRSGCLDQIMLGFNI